MASVSIVIVALIALFTLLIPVLIGVYVYRDAARRGMEAGMWTAVAIFVPGFIGLIIYLLCRKGEGARCPKCENPVSYEYALCPFCGQPLKGVCAGCGAPIDSGWRLCPRCGHEIAAGEYASHAASPVRRKDKKLGWLVAAVIALPVLALVVLILLLSLPGTGSSFGHSGTDSLSESDVSSEIQSWIKSCDDKGAGVYVLNLTSHMAAQLSPEESAGDTNLYVYVNGLKGSGGGERYFLESSRVSSGKLELRYSTQVVGSDTSMEKLNEMGVFDYVISRWAMFGVSKVNVKVYIDGKQVKAAVESWE